MRIINTQHSHGMPCEDEATLQLALNVLNSEGSSGCSSFSTLLAFRVTLELRFESAEVKVSLALNGSMIHHSQVNFFWLMKPSSFHEFFTCKASLGFGFNPCKS